MSLETTETTSQPTDDERKMSIDDVVKLFSRTIFWNYLEDWPGDQHKDPEYPLALSEKIPHNIDEPRTSTLYWVGGELSVHVATMHPIRDHQDAEDGITAYDVEFVQKLPVIIPTLLKEIDRLNAVLKTIALATEGK